MAHSSLPRLYPETAFSYCSKLIFRNFLPCFSNKVFCSLWMWSLAAAEPQCHRQRRYLRYHCSWLLWFFRFLQTQTRLVCKDKSLRSVDIFLIALFFKANIHAFVRIFKKNALYTLYMFYRKSKRWKTKKKHIHTNDLCRSEISFLRRKLG